MISRAVVENGRISLVFSYDISLIGKVKRLPDAKWSKAAKTWSSIATPYAAWQVVHGIGCRETCGETRRLAAQWGAVRAGSETEGIDLAGLWSHQQLACGAIAGRYAAILDMGMGTGKTLVAIRSQEHALAEMILVLCPKSVMGVWRREVERWERRPGATCCVLDSGGSKDKAETLRATLRRHNNQPAGRGPLYVAVNYESAWREEVAAVLLGQKWDCVLCDESHRIKSHSAVTSKFAAAVGQVAKRRLCLTGTLLPHSPLDIFGQMRFLDAGIFGTSWVSFRTRYAKCSQMFPSKVEKYINQEELAERISWFSYRCKSGDVLELPPKLFVDVPVSLCSHSARAYRELERELITEIEGGTVTATNALGRLVRLQQATSGYLPLDSENGEPKKLEVIGSDKEDALYDLLSDFPEHEPVVVFATFRHDLERIRAVAEKLGRSYGEISGTESTGLTDRATMAEVDICGVQWQSGGVGIDLTRAAYCVFYSHTFNMGNYDQAVARLHRPGQTRSVRYYRLIASGRVDEKIYTAIDTRREVVEYVFESMKKGELFDEQFSRLAGAK